MNENNGSSEQKRDEKAQDEFQRKAFLVVLTLITLTFVFMVRHFIITILLAAIFTGLSYPLFTRLSHKFHSRIAGAIATLLLLLLILVLPAAGIAMMAYQQAADLWTSGALISLFEGLTRFGNELRAILPAGLRHIYPSPAELAAAGERVLQSLGAEAGGWIKSAANALVKIALMFMFMFYFLLDGPRMLDRIIRWSPLPDGYERALFARFLVVGRGAFMGIFVIGALQGALTGLLLWATGVPSPVFLGVLALMASIIPAFGAGLIWVPASLYLFITGHIVGGLAVLIVGASVISTIDNLLRPAVVGKSIKMHDSIVLVSTLGGLIVFGLPGFLLGPIIAAFFLSAWGIYEEMFAVELERNREAVDTTSL